MISLKEFLMGRATEQTLPKDLLDNAVDLLSRVNKIRQAYGKPMRVSSGYRPAAINAAAGGAKRSNHMICKAIDIADPDGSIKTWMRQNEQLLVDNGLWAEHWEATPTWLHLQSVPPKSGNRWFKP